MEKYYITTPIYYPSANFHIGHCYTTIVADAIARYKRNKNYDVYFQTGTDEHGLKIETKAHDAGVSPKEYVDEVVENAKDLWKALDISYDYFIRTTDENHVKTVQKIFTKLYEQGDIYKGSYKGLYCIPCESFWTKTQLVDGKCPDCGREVKEVEEEAYFLKLSKYQDRLVKFLEEHPDFIEPESRKNEMINNFIKPGLEDLCVSRTSFKWGIPVPFDEKHVVYVWLDALTNYITSLGYLSDDDSKLKKYWPADLHLVGKEIIRFHTIVWPIILMALDLPLPKKVYGHGWLVIEGAKISKSLGNYRDPREYIKYFGVDAVRYFVLREVPFGSDGNFSVEALIDRTNADLANTLGNLVQRTISMANKYFDGVVTNKEYYEDLDTSLIDKINSLDEEISKDIDNLEISNALNKIFEVLRASNKYIDETTPWILAKDDASKDRLETVLYNLLESIRVCSINLSFAIPSTSKEILRQINNTREENSYLKDNKYEVGTPSVLFQRIDKDKFLKEHDL